MYEIFSFFLHIDQYLADIATEYGVLSYAILFVVVFLETGLVITPFLPGDSLLFAAGAVAAIGLFNFPVLLGLLFVAAVLGDSVNYWIGARLGHKVIQKLPPWMIKQEHLERAEQFYEDFGGYALVSGRFIPIVRTFVPFVAGLAHMNYGKFLLYNVGGAALWVGGVTTLGYFFGTLPWVQKNFGLTILAIVVLSFIPPILELWRKRRQARGAVN